MFKNVCAVMFKKFIFYLGKKINILHITTQKKYIESIVAFAPNIRKSTKNPIVQ